MKFANLIVAAVVSFGFAAPGLAPGASAVQSRVCHFDGIAFLGRWDLTLNAPEREWPSWIEISEEGGQLKARFTGRWGNARPLPKVEIIGRHAYLRLSQGRRGQQGRHGL